MVATYNLWLVFLSVVVAITVSYSALMLTARVAEGGTLAGRLWLMGGAIAMGLGIWSMHFIGMLAYSVDTPLLYSAWETMFSLVVAILTSGFALGVASRKHLSTARLSVSALIMGIGICSMHYSGMAAILITPAIRYNPWLVAASILIACVAAAAALWLAFRLRSGQPKHNIKLHSLAAIVMGVGISGMHYTGMAACRIAPGSICYGGTSIDNQSLALAIGMFALGILAITLITSIYDANRLTAISNSAIRLEHLNRQLNREKNLLSLATQAAGISSWEYDVEVRRVLWVENEIASLAAHGIHLQATPNAIVEMVHPDDRDVLNAAVQQATAEKRDTCSFACRIPIPGTDHTIHLDCHAQIFRDQDGEPTSLIAVSRDITEQIEQAQREATLQRQLRETSREAGMAEVAAGVLHNVGNTLNSLGISTAHVSGQLRASRIQKLPSLAKILTDSAPPGDVPTPDPDKARVAREYFATLASALVAENTTLQNELGTIEKHLTHIREIVSSQQAYAGQGGLVESVDIANLIDQAVACHLPPAEGVAVHRAYDAIPPFTADPHKLMQIFSNLITNARHALATCPAKRRHLHVTIKQTEDGGTCICVTDTGRGILAEDLPRLFEFGFTTKKTGHGFGLHHSALLARELGGSLSADSEGRDQGATFKLHLPPA